MLNTLFNIIIYPLIQIIEFVYCVFFSVTKNQGLAIIGVSIAVTLLCLPLYAIAEKLQQEERETQKKLKPKVDKIKAVFKGDEQYMILSTYYKQNHYHPIYALRSSISLLIQIPFFIAAYSFLSKLETLQGVGFLFIKDLGLQDGLISIGNLHINFLPIAMTLINCIAGAIYTKGFPLKEKLQLYIMALVFLVLLYTSPSGLVLYWTMNNVFSLFKNIFYKLKNPLKSFYYFCIACVIAAIGFMFTLKNLGFKVKLVVSVALIIIIIIPLLIKLLSPFFKNILHNFNEDEKTKNFVFVFSCIGLALLTGLSIPSNIISTSVSEFCFIEDIACPTYFIKLSFLQAIGLFIFWPCCFYFMFPQNIKTVISFTFFTLLLFTTADSFLFTNISSTMSNTFKLSYAKPPLSEIALNILTLLLIFSVICLIFKFSYKLKKFQIANFITIIFTFSFTITSIINISSIKKEYKELASVSSTNDIKTLNPVFHLSKTKQNVVVFMVDRAITGFLPYIFEETPELNNIYSGFTYYPNSISFGRYTIFGSAPLWGGYDYCIENMNKRSNVSLKDKQNEALKLLPKLFSDADYHIYDADMPFANFSQISDMSIFDDIPNVTTYNLKGNYTNYWCKDTNYNFVDNTKQLIERDSLWFSIFKCAPSILRFYIYENGNYWSASLFSDDRKNFIDSYAILDYLPELTSIDSDKNCCIFYNNETPHNELLLSSDTYSLTNEADKLNSYNLTKNNKKKKEYNSVYEDPLYHTTAAAIHRLSDFIKYLKENEVYDNTRIIFVSDHGNIPNYKFDNNPPPYDNGEIRYKVNCLLMFKDFNSNNDFNINNEFMTNCDVAYLATKDIIDNPVNPFTNNPILSKECKINPMLVTSNDNHRITSHNDNTFKIADNEWYRVKDNIFDNNNWSEGKNE